MSPPLQHAAEKAVFDGREVPFYGWHYPPFFLAIAVLVAAVPYAWGLAIWLIASFAAYLAAIRAILPRPETLAASASAFPAVFVNVGHGQNGFLTTALLGGALHWLDRRPALAGVLIGLLAYKPQFGVLIPIALLAGGRWRTIGRGGRDRCRVGRRQLPDARRRHLACVHRLDEFHADGRARTRRHRLAKDPVDLLGGADVGRQRAGRLCGAGRAAARSLAASMAWLWHSDAAFELKAAALAVGSLLATPYVLDYDLVVLAIAIAFFARYGLRHGFRDYEISLLAAAWIVPLLSRGIAGVTTIPLGLIVMLALYAFVCGARRSIAPTSRSARRESRKRDLNCQYVLIEIILHACSAVEVFDFFHSPGLATHR